MGTCQWRFIFAAVALLLDPTFADVLVQPGYGQPGHSLKKSVPENSNYKNQLAENAQQNYVQQQNPAIPLLQQQHMLQQQQLQNQHQQEHNQLLQLQQQQLQDSAMHQYPIAGDEVVGTSWGLRPPMYIPPFGSLHGGKLFSLGPFGLNSFKVGGLGGMGGPLLLAPQQAPETTGSNVLQKSMDSSAQSRTKRDVRDPGDSTGRKFRQKTSRPQQDGMAANPPLKSKPDATTPDAESSKTDDETVGDTRKNEEETVGSGLLDPLGLVDKTEDLIHNLKSGHFPNPMSMLNNGGRLPGLPNLLNSPKPGYPHIEEHVVGQSQQYQYPMQSKSDGEPTMMNQQFQPDQSQTQLVGNSRYSSYPLLPSSIPGQWGQPQSYGMYPQPYSSFGQPSSYGMYPQPYSSSGSTWMRSYNGMGTQGNQMAYTGNPMVGAANPVAQEFRGQTYPTNYPMTDATYPATQQRMADSKGYPQMVGGVRNSMVGEKQSSVMDSMYNRPNSRAIPSEPNLGSNHGPKPTNSNFSPEPKLGMSPDKMTGRGVPGASNVGAPLPVGGPMANEERNSMVGSPMMNNFYDPSRRMNNYYGFNDGSQRHRGFDIDDIFNSGYDQYHHGGYDRIYENTYDDSPFGFGGGHRPHHMHHQHSYF